MGRRLCVLGVLGLILAGAAATRRAAGGEIISLNTPAGAFRGEVVRVTRDEVVLKDATGKERVCPLVLLKPAEVYHCRKQVTAANDARGRFELGAYCLKNALKSEAETELRAAARLDPAGYQDPVAALLDPKPAPPPAQGSDPSAKTAASADPPTPPKTGTGAKDAPGKEDAGEDIVVVTGSDGKTHRVPSRFLPSKRDVKPRTDEEMKKFLADRKDELKKVCGADFVMEETPHFYLFSDLKKEQFQYFKVRVEELYKLLSEVMEYKPGDPLWNNKCVIYFLARRDQFAKFAAGIDRSPGAANSGGYFHHEGREVHIVIPLYDWMNEKEQLRTATDTLHHEGTHAFLQLVGKDVEINRWLHEGMAQFIEFWYDPQNNPGRNNLVSALRDYIRAGLILRWEEGRNRPMGMDRAGYAFAWTKVMFLYYAFLPDRGKLPRMIKQIKAGKPEDQAMEEVYGRKVSELESIWELWIKEQAKHNFKL